MLGGGVLEFGFVDVEDEDAVAGSEEGAGDAAADALGAAGDDDVFDFGGRGHWLVGRCELGGVRLVNNGKRC